MTSSTSKLENVVECTQEMGVITEILNKLKEVLSKEKFEKSREEVIKITKKIQKLNEESQKTTLSLVNARKDKKELEVTNKECRKKVTDARSKNKQLHDQIALLEHCRNNFASSEKDENVQGQEDCNEFVGT